MASFFDLVGSGAATAALLLAVGCGGNVAGGTGASGTGASGSGGSGTTTGAPATPDAAWGVTLSGNGPPCAIPSSTRQLGEVTPNSIQIRVSDQENVMGQVASVACAVIPDGSGAFTVSGHASLGADSLNISIASIDSTATMTSPATGSVSYISVATGAEYASDACNFYFPNAPQGVDQGKIWVTFDCPAVTSTASSPPSTCPLLQSIVVFEDCSTKPLH